MENTLVTYRGKVLEDMTKEELIEALRQQARREIAALEEDRRRSEFLSSLKFGRRK